MLVESIMIKNLIIKIYKKIFSSNNIFIIIFLLVFLDICIYREIDYSFRIVFLDIGQGDSILLKTPNYNYILIDGGEDSTVLDELGEVLPFWHRKIDIIIGTHSDCDHICGLKYVLEKYNVNKVFLNDLEGSDKDVQNIVNLCSLVGVSLSEMYMGDFIQVGDFYLKALWPEKDVVYENSNQSSIVLYGLFQEIDFLLTGDIEENQEECIVNSRSLENLEILKVSHHGSRTATGNEILERTDPKYAVISCGINNKFNHPSEDVVSRLIEHNIETFRTDLNGRVEFIISNGSVKIKLEKNFKGL